MQQKIRVLLIEDKPGDADSIRLSLLTHTTPAFTIIHETTLRHGIDRIKKEPPDIVLLDLDLPGSSGLASLHDFRKEDQDLPVVVLLQQGQLEIAAAAIESGAQDYCINTETERSFLPRILQHAIDQREAERKYQKIEKTLQEQDDTLNKIFDLLPVGLWFADKDGKLLRGNPAGIAIWGAEPHVKPEEYGIFKARRLSTGESIRPQDWALARTIRDGVTVAEELLEIEAFDGKTKIIANYSAPIIGADGKVQGAIVLNQDVTQRIKAEEFLQKSESSLRALLNAVDHSLFLMELDGTVVAINETTARRMGSTADEMVGKNIYTYVNHEVAELRRGYADKVIQSGQPIHFIDQRFDRWIDNSIFPVLDEKGNVQRLAIYGQDITDKINSEEILRLSEERFRTIFDQAPLGISLTDSKTGRFINVNARYAEIAGLSIEKLMQADWMQITDPRDLQADQDNMDLLLSGKVDKFQMEKRFVRPDGTTIWVNMTVVPVKVDALTSPRHLSMAEDITERKRAEAELRTNEERYRIISTVSSDYMFYTHVQPDGSLTLDWTAGAFETMTGYSLEEYSATGGWRGHVFADDLEVDNRDIEQLRNNQSVETEIRTVCKDGSILWVQVSAMPVINEVNGALIGIYGSVRDITERKHAEVELRESENKFRTLFMNTHTVMLILDPTNLRIIDANPAASTFYGWDLDTFRRKSMLEINTLGSTELLQNGKKVLEGELSSFQYKHRLANGDLRDVEVFSGPIEYEGQTRLFSIIHDISIRKKMETALRERERELSHLMNNLPGMAYRCIDDDTWTMLFVSQGCAELTGYPAEALVQNSILSYKDLIHPDDREYVQQQIHAAIQENKIYTLEYRIITADGSEKWVWERGELVQTPDTASSVLEGLIVDITSRKYAEQALQESETRFRHLYEQSPGPYQSLNEKGEIIEVNNAWLAELGYTHEEVIGSWFGKYLIKDQQETFQRNFSRFKKLGEVHGIEYSMVCKDRHIITVSFDGRIVRDSRGRFLQTHCVFSNITERKQTEAALKQSAEDLKKAQSVSHVGSWKWHVPTNTLEWSDEMYAIFGIDKASFTGDLSDVIARAIHPDDRKAVEASNLAVIEQNKPTPLEYRVIHPDGTVLTVWAEAGEMIVDQNNNVETLTGIVQDITVRKAAETQLLLQDAALKSAANGIIITDLNAIVEWANPAFCEMTGYAYAEVIGKNPRDLVKSGLHLPEFYTQVWDTILAGNVWRGEFINRRKDGTLYDEEEIITPIRNAAGAITHFIAIKEDITLRKHQEQRLMKQSYIQGKLVAMGRDLGATNDIDQIYRITSIYAREIFNAPNLRITLYDSEKRQLNLAFVVGNYKVIDTASFPSFPYSPEDPKAERSKVITTRQSIINNNLAAKIQAGDGSTSREDGWLPQSAIYVPMIAEGKILGVLDLQSYEQNVFTEETGEWLSMMANQAALAIQNARLYEQINRRMLMLSVMREIDASINTHQPSDSILNLALSRTCSYLNIDAADILLMDPSKNELVFHTGRGFTAPAAAAQGCGLAEKVMQSGRIHQYLTEESLLTATNACHMCVSEHFQAYIGVPIKIDDHVRGVLEVFHRSPFTPNSEWMQYLETLAGQVAIAIDNQELFSSLQETAEELLQAYDATIEGWSQAMDMRDRETEGHTRRVTDLSLKLAKAAGIPKSEWNHVRRGALLHDIGKLGVPDSILRKPDALDENEWNIMKQHPAFAYEMLKNVNYLKPALDIPRYHHEKWDGSGYPHGLRGDEIPLTARIFALADVWDALTNDRPYRSAWTIEQAMLYLRQQSGIHFDPSLVELFLNIIDTEK